MNDEFASRFAANSNRVVRNNAEGLRGRARDKTQMKECKRFEDGRTSVGRPSGTTTLVNASPRRTTPKSKRTTDADLIAPSLTCSFRQ